MRRLKFILCLSLASWTTLFAQEVTQQYDFWLGKWEVSWVEPQGKIGKGLNVIEKILDDQVIQENFKILEGQSKGFKGKSLSMYEKSTKTWKQTWFDNQGSFYYFKGKMEEGIPIFQTEVVLRPDGKPLIQRMRFENIRDDAFDWFWESTIDGGESWTLNWKITYKRME